MLPTEEELEAVPYGPCRDVMLRSRMVRSISSTDKPTPHAGLGLPGYVQFTSPIRRYGDMLAHWQLKVRWSRFVDLIMIDGKEISRGCCS